MSAFMTFNNNIDSLVEKLKQLEAVQAIKHPVIDEVFVPETTSSPTDTMSLFTSNQIKNTPVYKELYELIDNINMEQKRELLAIIWLGRGDYSSEEWDEAQKKAEEYPHHLISEYIITLPDACTYLTNGLTLYKNF